MGSITLPVSLVPVPTPIVTGAAPIDIDGTEQYYTITTGGTGGVEEINLTNLPLPIDGYVNAQHIGQRAIFVLVTQTNPADVVKINTPFANIYTYIRGAIPLNGLRQITNIRLDAVGYNATFVWVATTWQMDFTLSNFNITYTDVLTPGDWSNLVTENIPTADPHVAGQLWSNAGVATFSAG